MKLQYEISPLRLGSSLQRQLAACGQSKASPQQWIGIIRNLQQKGVAAAEVEWSGVISALEGCTVPSLKVDSLLESLSREPPCELVLQRHITNEYVPQVHYEKQSRPAELPPAVVYRGRREMRLLQYRDRSFGICIWLHVELDDGLFGRHCYWSLTVPRGGKKLGLPSAARRFATGQEALAYGRALVGRMARRLSHEGFIGTSKSHNLFTRYSLAGGENYTEWLITAPNLADKYWGEHFDLPNIIAHVRTTDRTSLQGLRLLVMEEIQSDWNQALRDAIQQTRQPQTARGDHDAPFDWDGDEESPPDNPYLNHWLDAALRMMLLLAAHRGLTGIVWLPGKLHAERFPWANAEGLATFYDHIVQAAVQKLAKSWGAQVGTTQFSTLSRHYCVEVVRSKGVWRVLNVKTGQLVGDEFVDHDKAEAFRQSMESPAVETAGALVLTPEIRTDLLRNGLPYLGSVGRRSVVASPKVAL